MTHPTQSHHTPTDMCSGTRCTQAEAEKPQAVANAEPFGLRAAWLHFANEIELRRLAKLHVRIERKRRALADLVGERQTIMNRCVRRLRRSQGKN